MTLLRRALCALLGHDETEPSFEVPADGSRRRRYETCVRCGVTWRVA